MQPASTQHSEHINDTRTQPYFGVEKFLGDHECLLKFVEPPNRSLHGAMGNISPSVLNCIWIFMSFNWILMCVCAGVWLLRGLPDDGTCDVPKHVDLLKSDEWYDMKALKPFFQFLVLQLSHTTHHSPAETLLSNLYATQCHNPSAWVCVCSIEHTTLVTHYEACQWCTSGCVLRLYKTGLYFQ